MYFVHTSIIVIRHIPSEISLAFFIVPYSVQGSFKTYEFKPMIPIVSTIRTQPFEMSFRGFHSSVFYIIYV